MSLTVRPARAADAAEMAVLLNRIIHQGGTTAHRQPFDADGITAAFIDEERVIACHCAFDAERMLGFQALEWADPDWPGSDRLPADWTLIATYVAIGRQRQGVGKRLFAATRGAATIAGVACIDATIRRRNRSGLAFYGSIGFTDYREGVDTVSKMLTLS